MNAEYRLIHLPEGMSIAALKEMVKMPDIRETIELMRGAAIVVMGIGRGCDGQTPWHEYVLRGNLTDLGAWVRAWVIFLISMGRRYIVLFSVCRAPHHAWTVL